MDASTIAKTCYSITCCHAYKWHSSYFCPWNVHANFVFLPLPYTLSFSSWKPIWDRQTDERARPVMRPIRMLWDAELYSHHRFLQWRHRQLKLKLSTCKTLKTPSRHTACELWPYILTHTHEQNVSSCLIKKQNCLYSNPLLVIEHLQSTESD